MTNNLETTTQTCPQLVQEIYDIINQSPYLQKSKEPDPERGNSPQEIRRWLYSRLNKITADQQKTIGSLSMRCRMANPEKLKIPFTMAESAIKKAYNILRKETTQKYKEILRNLEDVQ